ncbi:SPOR domain-containing protein [Dyella subtropica]|uniref:SPOR domain-containing protein n=1 Tax=Dyella subtropica TaxID=2992127 RepID=UPI002252A238|nr:SPOR domain-containing protein [Dyella subtropica]
MLKRLGFLLLLGFAFAGGALAPDTWRQFIALQASQLQRHAMATWSKYVSTPANADSLVIGTRVATPAIAEGQPIYALQLGEFINGAQADAAMQRYEAAARRLGLPMTTLAVVDSNKDPWTVLAIGQFPSQDAAEQAAPRVQATVGLESTPAIKLPAKPAS